jgi:predicted RNA-binding Zn-ribbon protein involved in translation (DUF1610 family)
MMVVRNLHERLRRLEEAATPAEPPCPECGPSPIPRRIDYRVAAAPAMNGPLGYHPGRICPACGKQGIGITVVDYNQGWPQQGGAQP